ncbi:MAG: ABC transporter ATP-binding protein [Planctomycetes bacterium]|jgi:ABC-type lipoprotein export system ATPase subunit|nr:ABC transporter ATP-binding protein [Planctomycetota bacterium]MCL4728966.1 ABC transporter ATP-binding protein [Planctomycetota bacterium]
MSEASTSSGPAIRIRGLVKTYNGEIRAVQDLDLDIMPGEMLAIMGKSGSGKSTLMNLIGTLDRPDRGVIEFFGRDIAHVSDLPRFRQQEIGFVFQLHCLLPHLTLQDNVALPLQGRRDAAELARQALHDVGLGHRLKHVPATVSGGERQRAAIARAIVNRPRVLLADEPTGNVDSESEKGLLDLFDRLRREKGMTLVVVTHESGVASRADRVVHYRDGRIERVESRNGAPGQAVLVP